MDKILPFITPGPMKERFKFSTRVFISWISLGLFLGLMFGIGWSIAGMSQATTAFFSYLIVLPILTCSFGLIGLGIDSMRGYSSNYQGWYWWLFPIITYFFVGFWLTFGLIFAVFSFVLTLTGNSSTQSKRASSKPNKEQLKRKKSKKILEEFGDKLKEQLQQEAKKIEQEPLKEQEKKDRLEALSIRERILLKIEENPEVPFEDILTDEEIDEFMAMLIEALL